MVHLFGVQPRKILWTTGFGCRRCYGLAYASQQESPRERGLLKAQKILMRLGAKPDLFDPFPEKPPRMHW
ncbi:MAG: hypothetical protein WCD52_03910, partial [Xanthobacteraceae bacterium]